MNDILLYKTRKKSLYIRYDLPVNFFTNFWSMLFRSSGCFFCKMHYSEHLTLFITISGCYIRYTRKTLFRTSGKIIPISLFSITISWPRLITNYGHGKKKFRTSGHIVGCSEGARRNVVHPLFTWKSFCQYRPNGLFLVFSVINKQLLTCATGNCAKRPLQQEQHIETTTSYAENNVVWI